ncbi:MAG TPA: hypothetical protein VEB59_10225 [Gemmatimonadales bacterium]|nr:hypothetical protein [Gemmatimonadales bacterium]
MIVYRAATALVLLAACRPDTTRPGIVPLPEAAATEMRVGTQEATKQFAAAMEAESLPPSRIRLRDGYVETAWLDSASGRPTGRRPIGTDVVKIRAWADPGRPGHTVLIAETVYRPLADPSLPERELERQVPREHPAALKIEKILAAMLARYGGPPRDSAATGGEAGAGEGGEQAEEPSYEEEQ